MDKPTSELQQALDLIAGLEKAHNKQAEAERERADAEKQTASILLDIERDLRAILDVHHWLTGFQEHCERQEKMERVVWACYYMLDILTKWVAVQEPQKREKELEDFRNVIKAAGIEDTVSEIRIEQIQVSGEADDPPETDKRKKRKK